MEILSTTVGSFDGHGVPIAGEAQVGVGELGGSTEALGNMAVAENDGAGFRKRIGIGVAVRSGDAGVGGGAGLTAVAAGRADRGRGRSWRRRHVCGVGGAGRWRWRVRFGAWLRRPRAASGEARGDGACRQRRGAAGGRNAGAGVGPDRPIRSDRRGAWATGASAGIFNLMDGVGKWRLIQARARGPLGRRRRWSMFSVWPVRSARAAWPGDCRVYKAWVSSALGGFQRPIAERGKIGFARAGDIADILARIGR